MFLPFFSVFFVFDSDYTNVVHTRGIQILRCSASEANKVTMYLAGFYLVHMESVHSEWSESQDIDR